MGLNDTFEKYLPQFHITPSQGGSGAWVKGPDGLNSQILGEHCAARGVLIEPGDIFFKKSSSAGQSHFRLGYSAIHVNLIEDGVREIDRAYRAIQI